MKKILLYGLFLFVTCGSLSSQTVNGLLYADTMGIRVYKIWGTHQERGYAQGYLTGDKITDMILNYIKPQFAAYYSSARNIIIQGTDVVIPQGYKDEAQGIIDGMEAAGTNTGNLDQTDILLSNSFLDVSNLLFKGGGNGCSSLMSWGDATSGSDLDGQSVLTRHMDWNISPVLTRNHTIIVQFPSEINEDKWLEIGFSGMMSALSGMNNAFGAVQHMMSDLTVFGQHNKHYTPIWFALRNALESTDYNNDGNRDVQDVRSALLDCQTGFANGYLVAAVGKNSSNDTLAAMVAELAPVAPIHTFRYNTYPDSIPGDNLYVANEQIARNNAMNFSARYNNVRSHIGAGTMMGLDASWNLMKNYSHQSTNIQFMQYSPEHNYLRVAVYRDNKPAYQNDPVVFDLDDLFSPVVSIPEHDKTVGLVIYPNPVLDRLMISGIVPGTYTVEISDITGKTVIETSLNMPSAGLDLFSLRKGYYTIRLTGREEVVNGKFLKN